MRPHVCRLLRSVRLSFSMDGGERSGQVQPMPCRAQHQLMTLSRESPAPASTHRRKGPTGEYSIRVSQPNPNADQSGHRGGKTESTTRARAWHSSTWSRRIDKVGARQTVDDTPPSSGVLLTAHQHDRGEADLAGTASALCPGTAPWLAKSRPPPSFSSPGSSSCRSTPHTPRPA